MRKIFLDFIGEVAAFTGMMWLFYLAFDGCFPMKGDVACIPFNAPFENLIYWLCLIFTFFSLAKKIIEKLLQKPAL